jgi:hypothetical protein
MLIWRYDQYNDFTAKPWTGPERGYSFALYMVQWMAQKSGQFDASVASSTMKIKQYALFTYLSHHTPAGGYLRPPWSSH